MKIIDAHAHLWQNQHTVVNGQPIYQMEPNRSRSMFFGEEVQMLPPFMTDGQNTAERFLSNMDYARVSAAVITQEFIDGLQNDYLETVQRRYPNRFFCFGMPDTRKPGFLEEAIRLIERGFRGIKIPAARLQQHFLNEEMMMLMKRLEGSGIILGIELQDGDAQVGQMEGGITWLFNDEFYPFPSAMKAIREAADEVGIDKLMWGSDYPRTITAITYKMSFDFVQKSDVLSLEEQQRFLAGNAQRFFGFDELVDLPYIKNMSE